MLEHGLMLQYLFAAMTLKPAGDSSLSAAENDAVDRWRHQIYGVARQEMGHLATVQNLLAAVGGGTHLDPPTFPARSQYYDPPLDFSLEPLTIKTIHQFIRFESPDPSAEVVILSIAPQPVQYKSVTDLYNQILDGMRRYPAGDLFIANAGQDTTNWSIDVHVGPVTDLAQAEAAIGSIIEDGEGTPSAGELSHYATFKRVRDEYNALLATRAEFCPHRPVCSNPTNPINPSPDGTVVDSSATGDVLGLFNFCYGTLLLILAQYFKFQEVFGQPVPDVHPGDLLKNMSVALMQSAIRPLGQDVLPELSIDFTNEVMAGPGFQVYGPIRLPWARKPSWQIIVERLRMAQSYCDLIKGNHPRLPKVAAELGAIADQMADFVG